MEGWDERVERWINGWMNRRRRMEEYEKNRGK